MKANLTTPTHNAHTPCEACSERIAALEPCSHADDQQIYLAEILALRSPWRSKARESFPRVEGCTCGDDRTCEEVAQERSLAEWEATRDEREARLEADMRELAAWRKRVRAHVESAPDPHVLHDACDRAMLADLEDSLENPEPPTPGSLEATRAMLERMGGTLVEASLEGPSPHGPRPNEYAPDAATVQAERDHEGICEMLLDLEEDAWREHLPEGAEWSGPAYVPSHVEPARDGEGCWGCWGCPNCEPVEEAPVHTPKVRDTAPMFDTWTPDDPEAFLAEMELANTFTSDPDDQGLADALLDAITDGEFTACMNHAEHREVASLGFSRQDRDGMHIISAE